MDRYCIVNPRYARRSFSADSLTARPQAVLVILVYNAQHVVYVCIQSLTQLMDDDQVTLAYLSKELPNGPTQNEYGKQPAIATGIRGLLLSFVEYFIQWRTNKGQEHSEEWME